MRVEDLILASISPPSLDQPSWGGLSTDAWNEFDQRLEAHRLQPLIAAEWARDGRLSEVPGDLAEKWKQSHRTSAMQWLVQQADLGLVVETLASEGIPAFALKGAWLGLHAYSEPALRPMRDLDLLVPEDRSAISFGLLKASGFKTLGDAAEETIDPSAKHMPPLRSARGTVVEIHNRCWEQDGFGGRTMPAQDSSAMIERAGEPDKDGVRYLHEEDMLANLVVHACFSSALDNGPLALTDMDAFIRATQIDWPRAWSRANEEGWARAMALLLAATDKWRRPGLLAQIDCPHRVPGETIEGITILLAQPMVNRAGASMLARASRDGVEHAVAAGIGKPKEGISDKFRKATALARAGLDRGARERAQAIVSLDRYLRE